MSRVVYTQIRNLRTQVSTLETNEQLKNHFINLIDDLFYKYKQSLPLCKYFKKNKCKNGSNCLYRHKLIKQNKRVIMVFIVSIIIYIKHVNIYMEINLLMEIILMVVFLTLHALVLILLQIIIILITKIVILI